MIRTENIKRHFRELEVLKGINLEIKEGEIISIVGASGAGKTTLLQILGTLDQANSGSLYFKDSPIGQFNPELVVHAKWHQRLIGYLIDLGLIFGIHAGVCFGLWGGYVPEFLFDEHWLWFVLVHLGILAAITPVYYFFFEALTSRTPGKMLTGTRVIDKFGRRPRIGAFLTRSLARLVPFEQFSFVSEIPQNGLHDGVSNTIVIRNSKRKADNNYTYAELGDDGLSRFRNEELGFVFQFHHLLPEFTALENVCLPGYVMSNNRKEVEKRAWELLSFLGLEDRIDHKPAELSGGEQQRVAVARALINKPAIILADEPSGNLDSNSARELHQLFFDLREKYNQTFIIVTHNDELANMADRKLVIRDGQIVSGQPPMPESVQA